MTTVIYILTSDIIVRGQINIHLKILFFLFFSRFFLCVRVYDGQTEKGG